MSQIPPELLSTLPPELLSKLSPSQISLLDIPERELRQAEYWQRHHKREGMFPDRGKFHRGLYPRHIAFFDAGAKYKERLFMAANRVGKTESGAEEATAHATGIYKPWWKGRRFHEPTEGWACGTTGETTRDIVQRSLIGKPADLGTGMIPAELIVGTKRRAHGLNDSFEQILVRHVSGGTSVIGLKTYEQGRKSFEGTSKHWIWCDEEPPEDCYTEMLIRTVTTRGIVWLTFTPLQGMSSVVKGFLEPTEEAKSYKWYIQAGWNHAPHIPEEEKKVLLATMPPHQIKARTEGEPALGIGAVYPIEESRITCKEMPIPESWPRSFGMDVGWKWTAAVWGARNPATNITYVYAEYLGAEEAPAVHAAAVRAKGVWIPGAIDPASNGRNQVDGRKLFEMYRNLGLLLNKADNAVPTGIQLCWEGFVDGSIKIMPSCENLLRELRRYHRDEKGKIVKADDHLCDALRYRMVSGRAIERTNFVRVNARPSGSDSGDRGWMA